MFITQRSQIFFLVELALASATYGVDLKKIGKEGRKEGVATMKTCSLFQSITTKLRARLTKCYASHTNDYCIKL